MNDVWIELCHIAFMIAATIVGCSVHQIILDKRTTARKKGEVEQTIIGGFAIYPKSHAKGLAG